MPPQSAAKGSPAHPLLVPAIAASQFAPPFMISGVAVALPALGADLGAGAPALPPPATPFPPGRGGAAAPCRAPGRRGRQGDALQARHGGVRALERSHRARLLGLGD